MDEMTLGGFIAIASALPGIVLGLALLVGKWRPASLAATPNPDRARVALGVFLVAIDALVLLLGVALMVLPPAQVLAMVKYAVAAILAASVVGALLLIRATRA